MTHDMLIWQERTNLANLNMFAQWSWISTIVTLLEIHGHFYSQKVCISCKNTPKKIWTSSTHVERPSLQLLNYLPCVVPPLVGIQKRLALHIFGPNFGWFKLKIIMDG
jgi:hypothetical protein